MQHDRQPISWSKLYDHRRQAAARFGKCVFTLPIVKRVRDVLAGAIRRDSAVLEVGAGDRHLGNWLVDDDRCASYESMDIDPTGHHDYRDLAAIDRQYDCIFALEVIEHLSLDEIRPWLARLRELLRPGGRLVLSTPNTFYPPAYLRDATHRTPLCYDELAGLVSSTGLEVTRIVRVYNDPVHRVLLRRYAFGWLFRMIGIDFARQIVLVAEKSIAITSESS